MEEVEDRRRGGERNIGLGVFIFTLLYCFPYLCVCESCLLARVPKRRIRKERWRLRKYSIINRIK